MSEAMALPTERRRRRHWMFLLGASLIALGMLTWTAYSFFTGTVTATHDTALGSMQLAFPTPGGQHRIGSASTDLVPGDFVERSLRLDIAANGGNTTMTDVKLTTSGNNGPPSFVTTATDGLQLWIQACSLPWTEANPGPGVYTYTCVGGGAVRSDVLGTGADPPNSVDFVQTNTLIGSSLDLTDGANNYLMVTVKLPTTADDSMQGQSSTLSFKFDGVQRAGSAH
jgi:hypothetical protein